MHLSAIRASSRRGLDAWFNHAPGSLVATAYQERLGVVLPDLFGFHLVQVGRIGDVNLLAPSRILHRAIIDIDDAPGASADPGGAASVVRGSADALPLDTDSVDVLVLPHVLEFEADPHAALREASRVVRPEGHLIVCGFNPWSLLGLWRLWRRRRGVAPWQGSFLAVNRLRDWLALLDFKVLSARQMFFLPPLRSATLLARLDFLESTGRRTLPYLGGTYLLVARKRRIAMTPLRPSWRPKRRLVGVGIAEPTARATHDE